MDKEKLLAFARARLRPVTCLDEIEVLEIGRAHV